MNYAFQPGNVSIRTGTEVVWTNADAVDHTVTVGAHGGGHTGAIDSGLIPQGQEFRYTFTTPGTYDYHCDPHPEMTATVVVTA